MNRCPFDVQKLSIALEYLSQPPNIRETLNFQELLKQAKNEEDTEEEWQFI